MSFLSPVLLMRKIRIIKLLTEAKAFSKESAKALDEINLINPYSFPGVVKRLVNSGMISKTEDGKDYINR